MLDSVLDITELKLKARQVTFWYLPDIWTQDLGIEFTIFVFGLIDKPERAEEVSQQLADNLKIAVNELFPMQN